MRVSDFNIKKGSIIVLASGAYSDFGYGPLGIALVDFNLKNIQKKYENFYKLNRDKYSWNDRDKVDFPNWIINVEKLIEEKSHDEIWVGDVYNDRVDMSLNNLDLNYEPRIERSGPIREWVSDIDSKL